MFKCQVNRKTSLTKNVLFFICIFFSSNPLFAQFDKLVQKVDPAVFKITFFNRHGTVSGSGSGFFVSADGLAYSTVELIDKQRYAIIKLTDGRSFTISNVISINEHSDFVAFQVNVGNDKVPFLNVSKETIAKGNSCFSFNNVDGIDNSLGIGYVSGFEEEFDGSRLIQTNIIGPTSGGGPVLNGKGEVFGIVKETRTKTTPIQYAYSVVGKLEKTTEFANLGSDEIYFFEKEFPREDKLQLNSVEFLDSMMVFNLSYHNYNFYRRSSSFIWVGVEDTSSTYKLIDRKTGKTYYAAYSSIGGSRQDPTTMDPGEVVEFYLAFLGVPPEIKNFDLVENMPGGNWSIYDLQLPAKGYLTIGDLQDSKKVHKRVVMNAVNNEDYYYADYLYEKYAPMYADDLGWQRLGAFICLQNDDFRKGIDYCMQILENGGGNMDDYMKMSHFYKELKVADSALLTIDKAIALEPSYRESYMIRAEIHIDLENWAEALNDLDRYYLEAGDEEVTYMYYVSRGFVKAKLGDASACKDFDLAREIAPDAQAFDYVNRVAKPYCKDGEKMK